MDMRWDEERNMIHTFVNDNEVEVGIDTPDWAHPIILVTSKASWPGRSIVYDGIMNETGYIKIMTCSSSIDFDIYVNASNSFLSRAIVDDSTVHYSAYHKCTYAGSDDSSFLVHKGDRVTFFYRFNAVEFAGVGGTSMAFIPILRGESF